jgi:hypothetical protein
MANRPVGLIRKKNKKTNHIPMYTHPKYGTYTYTYFISQQI